MREIGRVQQGYFPTQERILKFLAALFKFPDTSGCITVLDAGCGTGAAINELRNLWLADHPDLHINLLGIESDKNRCEQANQLLGSGSALWSAIEDACPSRPITLLYFNPPFDRVRGAGRSELILFEKVKDWPAKTNGLLLFIMPDHVLADPDVGLAVAIEREYEFLGLWRFPEPEYSEFKQCVLIARRRAKALDKTRLLFPNWALNPSGWPVLKDGMPPVAELKSHRGAVTLHRMRLGNDIILDAVSKSPLRGSMLREATSAAPPIGRPLLPLKHGHLALALAGGLCDGIIEADHTRFLIKGTLASAIRKTATKDSLDSEGNKVAEIDIFRTRYEMNVRCLLSDGSIEDYSSADENEALAAEDDEEELE